jgi:hypothetical protein
VARRPETAQGVYRLQVVRFRDLGEKQFHHLPLRREPSVPISSQLPQADTGPTDHDVLKPVAIEIIGDQITRAAPGRDDIRRKKRPAALRVEEY